MNMEYLSNLTSKDLEKMSKEELDYIKAEAQELLNQKIEEQNIYIENKKSQIEKIEHDKLGVDYMGIDEINKIYDEQEEHLQKSSSEIDKINNLVKNIDNTIEKSNNDKSNTLEDLNKELLEMIEKREQKVHELYDAGEPYIEMNEEIIEMNGMIAGLQATIEKVKNDTIKNVDEEIIDKEIDEAQEIINENNVETNISNNTLEELNKELLEMIEKREQKVYELYDAGEPYIEMNEEIIEMNGIIAGLQASIEKEKQSTRLLINEKIDFEKLTDEEINKLREKLREKANEPGFSNAEYAAIGDRLTEIDEYFENKKQEEQEIEITNDIGSNTVKINITEKIDFDKLNEAQINKLREILREKSYKPGYSNAEYAVIGDRLTEIDEYFEKKKQEEKTNENEYSDSDYTPWHNQSPEENELEEQKAKITKETENNTVKINITEKIDFDKLNEAQINKLREILREKSYKPGYSNAEYAVIGDRLTEIDEYFEKKKQEEKINENEYSNSYYTPGEEQSPEEDKSEIKEKNDLDKNSDRNIRIRNNISKKELKKLIALNEAMMDKIMEDEPMVDLNKGYDEDKFEQFASLYKETKEYKKALARLELKAKREFKLFADTYNKRSLFKKFLDKITGKKPDFEKIEKQFYEEKITYDEMMGGLKV